MNDIPPITWTPHQGGKMEITPAQVRAYGIPSGGKWVVWVRQRIRLLLEIHQEEVRLVDFA